FKKPSQVVIVKQIAREMAVQHKPRGALGNPRSLTWTKKHHLSGFNVVAGGEQIDAADCRERQETNAQSQSRGAPSWNEHSADMFARIGGSGRRCDLIQNSSTHDNSHAGEQSLESQVLRCEKSRSREQDRWSELFVSQSSNQRDR